MADDEFTAVETYLVSQGHDKGREGEFKTQV